MEGRKQYISIVKGKREVGLEYAEKREKIDEAIQKGQSVQVKVRSLGVGSMGALKDRRELEKEMARRFPH